MIEATDAITGLGLVYMVVGFVMVFLSGHHRSLATGETVTIVFWPVLLAAGFLYGAWSFFQRRDEDA